MNSIRRRLLASVAPETVALVLAVLFALAFVLGVQACSSSR